MSRVSKRLRKDPSPSPSSSPKLEAVSPKSEVNELNEDDYEKERMENIKYVPSPTIFSQEAE